MLVLLDGLALAVTPASLATALETVVADAQRRGRIVIEVKADGILLSDDALGDPSTAPSTVQQLQVTSADPRVLIRQTVLDAVEALDQAKVQQARAAEQIQTGETEEALRTLQFAFVTWQACRDVVDRGAAILGVKLDSLTLPGTDATFPEATSSLLLHLAQVKSALTEQDWSALSDIVGFDLDADAATWRALLTAFAEHVRTLPARGGAA